MIDALVPFPVLQRAGYGQDGRTLRRLCARYDIPVLKLNERQLALRQCGYETLLSRNEPSASSTAGSYPDGRAG